MIDNQAPHKSLLKMLIEQNIDAVSAADFRNYIETNSLNDVPGLEDIKLPDGKGITLVERVGDRVIIYDSNGKQWAYNKIPAEVIEALQGALAHYKLALKRFAFGIVFGDRAPLYISVEACDEKSARELLASKLRTITAEEPQSISLVK